MHLLFELKKRLAVNSVYATSFPLSSRSPSIPFLCLTPSSVLWQGWPQLCLYICSSLFTTGQLGQESKGETIDHWPDSGPQAGTALLFGLCDDFLKKGAPPSLIRLALLRFGLEPQYLPCMSIENTLDSLTAWFTRGWARQIECVMKLKGWGSTRCGPGRFLVVPSVPRSTTMRTLAAI